MSADVQHIAQMPFFSRLRDDEQQKLAGICQVEDHKAGEVLFREGDPPGDLYFVLEGRITLGIRTGGAESSVLSLGPGEMVGWSSLLRRPRVASGRVTQPARLLRVSASDLLSLSEQDPAIGYALMSQAFEEVADRLQDTRLQLLDMYGKR
ncbi:MAG: cyclic nucleotide-binding domain-containing protein [Sandaracinaceae bacterium]|nr:cyclic nucleotide-binding domain-containing protein [Sandaracinaceae bacterium]